MRSSAETLPLGGGTTDWREEDRAFLQRRVEVFSFICAGIGAGFWLFRLPFVLKVGGTVSFWFHLLAWLIFAAAWLFLRSERSVTAIRLAESLSLIGSSAAYTAMASSIPIRDRPDLILIIVLTYAVIARAVWVPSTATRTAVLSLLIGIPLLGMLFARILWAPADELAKLFPAIELSASGVALFVCAFAAAWWTTSSVLATMISRTQFGLREAARNVRRLGQYELEEKLGEGGMGLVYRASHAMLRRPTAVKILPPHKAGEKSIARFEREVRQTARLRHANTVTIYDYGRTPDGLFYYAMELLDGADLGQIVVLFGPMPAARVIRVLIDACGSLAEAHDMGLIHRDIKPSNILLCEQGGTYDVAKVVDFGLVKEIGEGMAASLSHADTIIGTPHYLAPEAIKSADGADPRSDLYALGAVGYFLLTGTPLFSGNVLEVCGHQLHTEPDAPSSRMDGELADDLEQVILGCLAKSPGDRPQDARELRAQLVACAQATVWTQEDAERWWEEHRDQLNKDRRGPASTSDRTLAIDLARRT